MLRLSMYARGVKSFTLLTRLEYMLYEKKRVVVVAKKGIDSGILPSFSPLSNVFDQGQEMDTGSPFLILRKKKQLQQEEEEW